MRGLDWAGGTEGGAESQPKGPPRTGLRAAAVVKDQQEAHVAAERYMRGRQEAREAVEEPCCFPKVAMGVLQSHCHSTMCCGGGEESLGWPGHEPRKKQQLVSGPEKMEQQRLTKAE